MVGVTISEEDKDRIIDLITEFREGFTTIYAETIAVLKSSIVVGNTNIPQGLMSLDLYTDMLHGGAYTDPVSALPYYDPWTQKQISFQQSTIGQLTQFLLTTPLNVTIPPPRDTNGNYLIGSDLVPPGDIQDISNGKVTYKFAGGIKTAALLVITLPTGAKPEQAEIIINSQAKHRFPKLISDQAYYLEKEWGSLFKATGLAGKLATTLSTLVNTIEGGGAEESKKKATPRKPSPRSSAKRTSQARAAETEA